MSVLCVVFDFGCIVVVDEMVGGSGRGKVNKEMGFFFFVVVFEDKNGD